MKTLVIIPTYNERENIERLIKGILSLEADFEILVVDDNSPDETGEVVERVARKNSQVHIVHRPKKLGLGTAYIAGFKWALQRNYDFIFEMDADFSHDPKYLPKFLQVIENYDLVIGSRYLNGISTVNWSIGRLILSFLANKYTKLLTGLPINDCTSGFKCYRAELLKSIDLDKVHSSGYAFQIEMKFRAHQKGFRVKELPIVFIERRGGKSKMGKKIIWEAFWMVLRLRMGMGRKVPKLVV